MVSQAAVRRVAAAACAVGALIVGAGTAGAAPTPPPSEGRILGADRAGAVAGSYIVTFKDSVARTDVDKVARSLAGRHGGKVGHTYTAALRGFSVKADEGQARRLAADPSVARVEADGVAYALGTQNDPTWGLDRIDQRDLPGDRKFTYPNTASNVTAYVLDTGIRTSHQEFGGRAVSGYDFIDNDSVAQDCNGHGTHVAGTVGGATYGVAKAVKLVGVRVLNCQGSSGSTWAPVLAGIDWVTKNAVKPAVANMSIGGGRTSSVDDALAKSIASGVTYVVAAGNDGANACNTSPAAVPSAVTVGATDNRDARSIWPSGKSSNHGTCLDLFAPGSDIVSASHLNDTGSRSDGGTSMASPHVAGAAALLLSANPSWTPKQVHDRLIADATPNKVTDAKTGSPNRLLYVPNDGTTPPPTGKTFENTTAYPIRDNSTVESPITVSGITGNAPATLSVTVDIRHTFRGDLRVDLVAPVGGVFRLKDYNANDSADDVRGTFTVNAASKPANGSWKLRVSDNWVNDTGTLNSWSLKF
ncbi:S8 family serine peptidase [Streptomyces sp. SID8374]|uniref:S8 family peptidase n=1 Tax=Streptomyces sp. SID8374 TaxID=2690354 RepID=UPI00136F6956|nr:S8 family peptidase [Streptomyces sp. SID8374]MYX17006.1 S8 family serine peptidase [Streptomyces sp. SID8374]